MDPVISALDSGSQLQQAQRKRVDDKLEQFAKKDLSGLSNDKIREIAQEFESFFLSQVLEQITKGLETDGFFGGGHAEGIYRSMMNEEYGKSMAKRGGTGIADMLFKDMIRLQQQQMRSNSITTNQEASEAYSILQKEKQQHPSLKPTTSVTPVAVDRPSDYLQKGVLKNDTR